MRANNVVQMLAAKLNNLYIRQGDEMNYTLGVLVAGTAARASSEIVYDGVDIMSCDSPGDKY